MKITILQGAGCFSGPRTHAVDTAAPPAGASALHLAMLESIAREVRSQGRPLPSPGGFGGVPHYTVTIVDGMDQFTARYNGLPDAVGRLYALVQTVNRLAQAPGLPGWELEA